ncbi:hypothetical protein [Microcystis phage Mae-JY24]
MSLVAANAYVTQKILRAWTATEEVKFAREASMVELRELVESSRNSPETLPRVELPMVVWDWFPITAGDGASDTLNWGISVAAHYLFETSPKDVSGNPVPMTPLQIRAAAFGALDAAFGAFHNRSALLWDADGDGADDDPRPITNVSIEGDVGANSEINQMLLAVRLPLYAVSVRINATVQRQPL